MDFGGPRRARARAVWATAAASVLLRLALGKAVCAVIRRAAKRQCISSVLMTLAIYVFRRAATCRCLDAPSELADLRRTAGRGESVPRAVAALPSKDKALP